jgi:hypothetical protein
MLADIGLILGYGLITITALATINFAVIDISRTPNAAMKSLAIVGGFVLIVLLSYLLTS